MDAAKLKAKQEVINICMKMDDLQDIEFTGFNSNSNDFGIDDIYKFQDKRITDNLNTIIPDLKR